MDLISAIEEKDFNDVEIILQGTTKVDQFVLDTALVKACSSRFLNYEIIKLLIDKGANCQYENSRCLVQSFYSYHNLKEINLLIKHGASCIDHMELLLLIAIKNCNNEYIQFLYQKANENKIKINYLSDSLLQAFCEINTKKSAEYRLETLKLLINLQKEQLLL